VGEIFVSHASADDVLVEQIVGRLRRDGYRSLFLDFDPEVGIAAGRPWLHELYRMLSQCRALVAVCTASWLESQWCFAEFTYARALGKAVFANLLAASSHTRPSMGLTSGFSMRQIRYFSRVDRLSNRKPESSFSTPIIFNGLFKTLSGLASASRRICLISYQSFEPSHAALFNLYREFS
jgi:hypothetical protein